MESISLEKTKLALVDSSRISSVLEELGIICMGTTGGSEKEQLFLSKEDLKDNIAAKCEGCGKEISLSSLGHITHGSKLLYCKNPLCFNHYLANRKMR